MYDVTNQSNLIEFMLNPQSFADANSSSPFTFRYVSDKLPRVTKLVCIFMAKLNFIEDGSSSVNLIQDLLYSLFLFQKAIKHYSE